MIRLREKFRRSPSTSRRSSSNSDGRVDIYLPGMAIRKVWVKRANASATQVAIGPDDLVDDVRDAVIRKYMNSLGRAFDAPDVSLRICPREQTNKAGNERLLAPDEPILRLIDAYYPGGQTVEEALVIDVPQRRTPRPSPRPGPHMPTYYIPEELRPGEAGDYFPPMPALHSPHLNSHGTLPTSHPANSHLHSMTVLTTGQLPLLPSPGGRSNRQRPKAGRQHTSSPTISHSGQASSNISGVH
jgi:osomolarity two-component system, response regulator SSK1